MQPTISPTNQPLPVLSLDSQSTLPDSLTSFSPDSSARGHKKFNALSPYERKEYYDIVQHPDAMFPVLVQDRITKLSAKFRQRASSPGQQEQIDSPVEETTEEYEEETQTFKRLRIFEDEEEFNVKKTHLPKFRGRREVYGGSFDRCKSLDTDNLPLDRVQEDKNEDDLRFENQRNRKMTWNVVQDLNEFNSEKKRRGSFGLVNEGRYKKFSLQNANSKDTIVEEQEKRNVPFFQPPLLFLGQPNPSSTNSSCGSYHGSLHSSPRFKLKVDELDIKEKDKKDEDENEYEEIEMILEEAEEKNLECQENKEFQNAKHKLQAEKEFMEKVLKGDLIDGSDAVVNPLHTEKEYVFMKNEPIQEEAEEEIKNEANQNE